MHTIILACACMLFCVLFLNTRLPYTTLATYAFACWLMHFLSLCCFVCALLQLHMVRMCVLMYDDSMVCGRYLVRVCGHYCVLFVAHINKTQHSTHMHGSMIAMLLLSPLLL